MSKEKFEMRINSRRKLLLEQVMDRIEPRTEFDSKARNVEEAIKLGLKYLDRMEEKKQEIGNKKQEIEETKKRWETDNFKMDD